MSIPSPKVSSSNRLLYQRLKQALKLNLRRQIFIAVCDDLWLRDCLAARLQAELADTEPWEKTAGDLEESTPDRELKNAKHYPELSKLQTPNSKLPYPRFVSLELSLSNPNPITQIVEWLADCPTPQQAYFRNSSPAFQILGAERLTREPAAVQWSFLNSLRSIERHLPTWQFNLLLWIPRPWLFTIQQSVPEFWRWHTGVFEFEGEPTPAMGERGRWGEGEMGRGGDGERRILDSKLQTPNSELTTLKTGRRGDGEVGILGSKLQTPNSELTTLKTGRRGDGEMGIPDSKLQTPNSKLQTPNSKLQTPNSKLQTPNSLELADLVLTAASGELEGGDRLSVATGQNFVPLQTLQYIERLHEQQCSSQTLALAYQTLGNFYRDRILAGDVSRTYLVIAVRAYEQVIELTTEDFGHQGNKQQVQECTALIREFHQNLTQLSGGLHLPSTVPNVLNDLGTLYWMLSRYPSSKETPSVALSDLEHSIALYQQALAQTDPKAQPQSYARLQKNLGATWGDLARFRDSTQNLQHSITAYQQALLHIDRDAEAQHYAAVQNNLGTAYWNLAQHDRPVAHLESAIAAYTKALCCYSPEREPLNYAGVQNNLGTAWWNLAQHEPSEALLLEAVNAYREALKYRTQDLVPAACAATQNNLGTVYWHLANLRQKQGRVEALKDAVSAYQSAIAAAKQIHPNQLTFDLLAAYNNLGLAHYQLATDPYFFLSKLELKAHLESALQNHLQACTGWQQQINGSGLAGSENANSQSPIPKPVYADCRQSALSCIVKTIRAFYSECGLQGQNLALSKVPGDLLPEILQQL